MPSLLRSTRANLLLFAAVLASLTVGTVSIGEAHTGHGLLCGAVYLLIVGSALALLLFRPVSRWLVRLLATPAVWAVLLLGLAAADQAHFRSSELQDNPLTSSLALEEPARALLHGREPYSVHLFHNAPISPGPGWIVLLSPLTVWHGTGLLGMLALLFAARRIAHRASLASGVFCVLLLCGPLFESQAANGQDLYVIAMACVVVCLLLERFADRPVMVATIAVFAGIVATARLPFVAILLIPGLGLFRRHRKSGAGYLLTMPLIALLLDGGFALWAWHDGDRFQPMHIFRRGTAAAGHGAQLAVALLLSAALFWVVRRMRGSAEDWMLGTWFALTALFLPEAVKEFAQMHHDLRWEGSTYATFPLPLLAAVLALRSRILSGTAEHAAQ